MYLSIASITFYFIISAADKIGSGFFGSDLLDSDLVGSDFSLDFSLAFSDSILVSSGLDDSDSDDPDLPYRCPTAIVLFISESCGSYCFMISLIYLMATYFILFMSYVY